MSREGDQLRTFLETVRTALSASPDGRLWSDAVDQALRNVEALERRQTAEAKLEWATETLTPEFRAALREHGAEGL